MFDPCSIRGQSFFIPNSLAGSVSVRVHQPFPNDSPETARIAPMMPNSTLPTGGPSVGEKVSKKIAQQWTLPPQELVNTCQKTRSVGRPVKHFPSEAGTSPQPYRQNHHLVDQPRTGSHPADSATPTLRGHAIRIFVPITLGCHIQTSSCGHACLQGGRNARSPATTHTPNRKAPASPRTNPNLNPEPCM